MSELSEGMWKCKVLSGEAAADDKDIMKVRINVEIIDGPDKGRRTTYEDAVNNKSAKYIAQSAKAVGWRGGRLESTFRADVDAWIEKTGGESTVEIRHVEVKKGKKFDAWIDGGSRGPRPVWDKANSIGRGPPPLRAPSKTSADDAAEALAMADDAGSAGEDVPPPSDDDLPFATCSMTFDRAVWR